MSITINVDELDISNVYVGMLATITVDAITSQTFIGEVIAVSNTSSSSSGVAKYAVQVLLDMNSAMKSGMSAQATLLTASIDNVLYIPVAAVYESLEGEYVYIKNNKGTLSEKVFIETGRSTGTYVEVTSGLSEGDTVYYVVTSSTDVNNSQSSSDNNSSFTPGGSITFPSGGDSSSAFPTMPSGGGSESGTKPSRG